MLPGQVDPVTRISSLQSQVSPFAYARSFPGGMLGMSLKYLIILLSLSHFYRSYEEPCTTLFVSNLPGDVKERVLFLLFQFLKFFYKGAFVVIPVYAWLQRYAAFTKRRTSSCVLCRFC